MTEPIAASGTETAGEAAAKVEPKGPIVRLEDGSWNVEVDGQRQSFTDQDFQHMILLARQAEIEMPKLQDRSGKLAAFEDVLAANPEAAARINQVLRAAALGLPLSGHGEGDAGAEGGGELDEKDRLIRELQHKVQNLDRAQQGQQAQQRMAAELATARNLLAAHPFLKARPALLEKAVRDVERARAVNPSTPVERAVREVATELKTAIESDLSTQVQSQNQRSGLETVSPSSGAPRVITGGKPLSAQQVHDGEAVPRVQKSLMDFLGQQIQRRLEAKQ